MRSIFTEVKLPKACVNLEVKFAGWMPKVPEAKALYAGHVFHLIGAFAYRDEANRDRILFRIYHPKRKFSLRVAPEDLSRKGRNFPKIAGSLLNRG